MQKNKNGIPVQTKTAQQQRAELLEDKQLRMKRFALVNSECDCEVVVPNFSHLIEVLKQDGWREIR